MPPARAKMLTLLMAVAICAQTPAWSARFVDTSSSWTEKYINRLSDKGVIPAADDGKFNPDKPITRAQLADWLVKTLGIDNQPVPQTSSFPDVQPTDWFFKPVEIIRQNNYISGYADGFRPNQFIQRAEVLTILSRALNMPEPDLPTISSELKKFKDGDKVPGWAKAGVAEAAIAGIIVNEQDPKALNPTTIAKRGETVAFLSRLDDYMAHRSIETASQPPADGGATSAPAPGSAPPSTGAPPPSTAYGAPNTGAPISGQVSHENFAPPPQTNSNYQAPPAQTNTNYQAPPPPQYAAAQPQYAPTNNYQAPPPNYLQGGVQVIAPGTNFQAQLTNTLDSAVSQQGEQVQATINAPLYVNGVEAVPSGSKLIGSVTSVMSARRFHAGENGKIDIRFNQLEFPDGRRFPLSASVDANQIHMVGGTTAGRVGKGLASAGIGAGAGAVAGTALGAIVGATSGAPSVGRSLAMGAIFGTAIGGGVGAIGGVVRKGAEVKFPAGMSLPIKLDSSVQITPPVPQPYYSSNAGSSYQAPPPQQPQPPQMPANYTLPMPPGAPQGPQLR